MRRRDFLRAVGAAATAAAAPAALQRALGAAPPELGDMLDIAGRAMDAAIPGLDWRQDPVVLQHYRPLMSAIMQKLRAELVDPFSVVDEAMKRGHGAVVEAKIRRAHQISGEVTEAFIEAMRSAEVTQATFLAYARHTMLDSLWGTPYQS